MEIPTMWIIVNGSVVNYYAQFNYKWVEWAHVKVRAEAHLHLLILNINLWMCLRMSLFSITGKIDAFIMECRHCQTWSFTITRVSTKGDCCAMCSATIFILYYCASLEKMKLHLNIVHFSVDVHDCSLLYFSETAAKKTLKKLPVLPTTTLQEHPSLTYWWVLAAAIEYCLNVNGWMPLKRIILIPTFWNGPVSCIGSIDNAVTISGFLLTVTDNFIYVCMYIYGLEFSIGGVELYTA